MRIGFFTDAYRPHTNGVVTAVDSYRGELERRGHEVWVFGPSLPLKEPDPPRTMRFRGLTFPGQPEYKMVFPIGRGCRVSDIPKLGLDMVHLHSEFGVALMGLAIARKHGIPAIFTNHTYWANYLHYLPGPEWVYRRLARNLHRLINERFPIVLAPTHALRDTLLSYGVRSRIEILPTGVDLVKCRPREGGAAVRASLKVPAGHRLYASAGRLGLEKSWDELLEALAIFKRRAPRKRWRLALMGDGPERGALERLILRLGLEEEVILTGYVSRQRVVDVFAASDAFVFASKSETQGMVVVEALAQGTPCVCVDVMGPGEMLRDGKGGLLAEPRPQDLAAQLLKLESSPALQRQKRREALAKARLYDLRRLTARMLGYYQEVIALSKRPAA